MEELLAQQDERLPFLHPVWLRTWLSEFGDRCEPLFLTASTRDAAGIGLDGVAAPLQINPEVTGVAPLMLLDDRLTFIGDPNICDFMDILKSPTHAEAACADIWRQITTLDWSELDLWGLMSSSLTRRHLPPLARDAGFAVSEEAEAVAPRLALPADWESYLASLNKKDRHELRRKIRRLFESGGGVHHDVLSEQSDVVAAMETFLDLHTRSRQDKTDFMTDEMTSFFLRMASALSAAGLIRLFMLNINNRPAASVLCFDAGSHLYLYNSGYDPEFSALSVGLVSKALCLRWAIENGKTGIDFLRGNEPYKYDLGARDQEIYRLRIRRPQ